MNYRIIIICLNTIFCSAFNITYPTTFEDLKFERPYLENGEQIRSRINAFCEDSHGFIWVASQLGLLRYDGCEFRAYQFDSSDSTTLSSNIIFALDIDRDDVLWVGTENGLDRFNPATGKIIHYRHSQSDTSSISSNQIESIYVDCENTVWIGTRDAGLNQFNRNINNFIHFQHQSNQPQSISHDYVKTILEDNHQNLWLGTMGGGLNLLPRNLRNTSRSRFIRLRHDPANPNSLSHDYVLALAHDSSGGIWVGTADGGLNYLESNDCDKNPDTARFARFFPDSKTYQNHPAIWSILIDRKQQIWLGTFGGGLGQFDPGKKALKYYQADFSSAQNLSEDKTLTLFEDRRGIIWIGTANSEINLIYPVQKNLHFHPIMVRDENGRELPADIFAIYPKSGNHLWLGTFGNGLLDYNLITKEVRSIRNKNGQAQQAPIFTLDKRQPNKLLVTTYGQGTYELNEQTLEFTASKIWNFDITPHEGLLYFVKDHLGCYWMTTFGNGLKRYDPNKKKSFHYVYEPNNPASLSSNITSGLCLDCRGNIWIGTFGRGVDLLEKGTILKADESWQPHFKHFTHNPADPASLANNSITMIFEDSHHNLWIGTYGGGICRYDFEKSNFIRFDEKQGLVDNHISSIFEDKHQQVWFGTHSGISKIDPETEKISSFDADDGLPITHFNAGSHWKSQSGELFIGGKGGVVSFFPEEIQENDIAPTVHIMEISINERPAQLDSAIFVKRLLRLNFRQHSLSFKFSALNFMHPQKNRYAFKMEGVDQDWIFCQQNRQTRYTNLTPGKYIFRVKAANDAGIWNEQGTSIRILIAPPWWQTIWAYLGYFFIAFSLVFSLWRFKVNRLKLTNELERNRFEARSLAEIYRLKSRFFTNISHEFRTPLTLILGPLEQLLNGEIQGNKKLHYKIMLRSARRLQRLINQLLEISKIEAGQMTLSVEFTDITREARNRVFAFISLAESRGIRLKFSATHAINGLLDVDKFEKIICNLISNALKFTPKGGVVEVAISTNIISENPNAGLVAGEYLQLVVQDTGKGIPAEQIPRIFDRFYQTDDSTRCEQEGSGIGLALVKELVSVYRGKIGVESQPGQGTRFEVQLPIGRTCFRENEILNSAFPKLSLNQSESVQDQLAVQLLSIPNNGNGKIPSAKVLLVEDNPDMVAYIQVSISKNFQIITAENGALGLEKARKLIPDIIISDVMMPQMNGIEFCTQIKSDAQTSHIPVILLTARAAMEDKIEGLASGADDYLIKPFNIHELQVRMTNLITQRSKLREHFRQDAYLPLTELAVTPVDQEFLLRLNTLVQQNITNLQFDVEKMAEAIGMSRSQLHRKLSALTNQSPGAFLRMIRLRHAARLLESGAGNVAQVALEVGYNNLSHFAKSFQAHFGVLPSEYAKRN